MIQCPKCGVAIADGTRFCSNCGNVFGVAQPQMPPKNKSNLKTILIVLGCVIGSCVLCGLIGGIKEAINPTPKTEVANQSIINTSTTKDMAQTKPSATANPKDEISTINWNDLERIYNLKSNSTDMQKEALWKDYKGKRVAWTGTVSEVSKGTFGGLSLQIKMNPDTLTSDILLSLKKEEEGKAMSLTKGSKVSFVGTLNNYGGALLPMSLDDGEIK
ncbi:MAG: zinc-ribbon domain-containing protein [Acidobacteriota bacterium]|nr:zinc-ribbon domain-containing protein [Acidobacteriota bacterium]